ncbi:MAG: aspartate carbamoyltransferase [Alphaproteobacteria bacterium]|nr:aspartate carbamoyltransferase [Alphaproteobacteria bacterium]
MTKRDTTGVQSPNSKAPAELASRHLLGIEGMSPIEIRSLLDRGHMFADNPHDGVSDALRGKTIINLFYENSTRTRVSFELAAKRLGSQHVDAAVINAGDGRHEHPTQALLDALTIRRRIGRIEGLKIAICGDIANSRVARSNIHLLGTLGAELRLVCPVTLLPADICNMGVSVFTDFETGIEGCDIVMMLRLQTERMAGTETPSQREYFNLFGLDSGKLMRAAPKALVMHPGPMNRGVEIDSATADDVEKSLIRTQVEMGVAARMACLEALVTRPA